nr:immunoglobulin light chain junction region [Macaca mulatta]
CSAWDSSLSSPLF